MEGSGIVKSFIDVADFPLVITLTFPVVADAGTVTTRLVLVALVIVADTPLNSTLFSDSVVLKFSPAMVTLIPVGPESGVKLPIEGEGGGSGSFSSSLHETMNVERIAIEKIIDSFRAFDIRIQFVLMMPQLGTKMNLANRRSVAWLWCVRFGCGLYFCSASSRLTC